MNLYQKNLWTLFSVSLGLTLTVPIFLPSWKLFFFVPYLIVLIYKKPLKIALWGAAGCGLILDLFSAQIHLGLHATLFVIVSSLLYPQRKHFFADSLSTLPLMTFFFSVLVTALLFPSLSILDQPLAISKSWIAKDLLFYPALDALFAFCVWILPFYLFGRPSRRGKDYFLRG